MTYQELLRLPKWQKKRLEIFNRDEWKCTRCGSPDDILVVHHLWYPPHGKMPWEVPSEALQTLCERCHSLGHGLGDWNCTNLRDTPEYEADGQWCFLDWIEASGMGLGAEKHADFAAARAAWEKTAWDGDLSLRTSPRLLFVKENPIFVFKADNNGTVYVCSKMKIIDWIVDLMEIEHRAEAAAS